MRRDRDSEGGLAQGSMYIVSVFVFVEDTRAYVYSLCESTKGNVSWPEGEYT